MQGRERILEDHADVPAAKLAHAGLGQRDEVLALEQRLAGDPGRGALEQAHERLAGDRFAGSGFADDAEGLPALQG